VEGGVLVAVELLAQYGGDLAAGGALGQDALVRGAEGDAEERARREQQDREHGQGGERGTPHDGAGQPSPQGCPRGGTGAVRPGQPPAVDPVAQDDEQRRHDEQGADGRDDDDPDTGVAEGAQEVLREHQECRERRRHGRGGERDRTARGAHRAPDGVVHARS
jgi:hypothetical protein